MLPNAAVFFVSRKGAKAQRTDLGTWARRGEARVVCSPGGSPGDALRIGSSARTGERVWHWQRPAVWALPVLSGLHACDGRGAYTRARGRLTLALVRVIFARMSRSCCCLPPLSSDGGQCSRRCWQPAKSRLEFVSLLSHHLEGGGKQRHERRRAIWFSKSGLVLRLLLLFGLSVYCFGFVFWFLRAGRPDYDGASSGTTG
jgi:hypothetical protein